MRNLVRFPSRDSYGDRESVGYAFSISLDSHDLAIAQSRLTVAAEIPSASAVSSMVRPAKNRILLLAA